MVSRFGAGIFKTVHLMVSSRDRADRGSSDVNQYADSRPSTVAAIFRTQVRINFKLVNLCRFPPLASIVNSHRPAKPCRLDDGPCM